MQTADFGLEMAVSLSAEPCCCYVAHPGIRISRMAANKWWPCLLDHHKQSNCFLRETRCPSRPVYVG